jgi:hypothetical protein
VADETAELWPDARSGLDPAERRLLAEMPLHAITSVHGEAGLRERLSIEIADFPAPDQDRVRDALALALRLHAGDRRQREPYVDHLLRGDDPDPESLPSQVLQLLFHVECSHAACSVTAG